MVSSAPWTQTNSSGSRFQRSTHELIRSSSSATEEKLVLVSRRVNTENQVESRRAGRRVVEVPAAPFPMLEPVPDRFGRSTR